MWWIIGAGTIFALIFAIMSSILLNLGVLLKLKGEAEREISAYMSRLENDPNTPLMADDFYHVYTSIDDIPEPIKLIFKPENFEHEDYDFFVDIDYDESEDTPADEFTDLCDGQKCQILFLYAYRMPEGQWLYLLTGIQLTEAEDQERDTVQDAALYFALFIIFLFSLLALLLFRRISQPVQAISQWASELTVKNVKQDLPSFRYQELNVVALKLQEAFARTAESTEKERRFLQYASHELRTPIAVAAGNIELLEKLDGFSDLSGQEKQALERIKYSVTDMRLLTETLLWLNRKDAISPPVEVIDLLELCQNSIDDNSYLLKGKSVSIDLRGLPVCVEEPPVFCTILISNLIRNAFQHTQKGGVEVSLSNSSLRILNWEISDSALVTDSEQVGFGLGLDLVEQIAERLGWYYHCEIGGSGRECLLRFKPV